MATILTKKKDTSGAPSAGDLTNSTGGAELAVNTADKRLYTKDSGGNVVEIGTNPTSITTGTLNTSGAVVFNDAGADVDFRVEGDTDANLLFVDASADAVGIGTNTPDKKLHVVGDDGVTTFSSYGARDFLVVENNQNTNIQIVSNSANSGNILFSDEAASGRGAITYDHSSDDMVFKSAATEAARFTSAGNLKFPDGQGIDFSDSAGGGASSSILDDYEEGTWTPVLADASSGGNASPTSATNANYTKIGNLVNVQCQFTNIDTTGMTGASTIFIRNFPFSALSVSGTLLLPGSIILQAVTFSGYAVPYIIDNTTYGAFRQVSSGLTSSTLTVGDISSGTSDFWMSLTYQAA